MRQTIAHNYPLELHRLDHVAILEGLGRFGIGSGEELCMLTGQNGSVRSIDGYLRRFTDVATREEQVELTVATLAGIEGIEREAAQSLVNAGFLTIDGILAADVSDLVEMTDMDEETATRVRDAAQATRPGEDQA